MRRNKAEYIRVPLRRDKSRLGFVAIRAEGYDPPIGERSRDNFDGRQVLEIEANLRTFALTPIEISRYKRAFPAKPKLFQGTPRHES